MLVGEDIKSRWTEIEILSRTSFFTVLIGMLYLSICAACSTHRTGSFLRGSEACWVIERGQLAQVKQMEMQCVYVWGGVWQESNSRGFISSPVGGRERHWPDPTHGRACVQYFSLPLLVCFPLWQIVVSLFSSIYPLCSFHFLGL